MNIEKEIKEEQERAAKKHPDKFLSLHDGHGVIREEMDELLEDFKHMDKYMQLMWLSVKQDNTTATLYDATYLKQYGTLALYELIQVIAMADKFIYSFNQEGNPNE